MIKRSAIKWIGDRPEAHFTTVPNELARDGELTSAARSVALYLWSHADNFPVGGERPIGKALGMSAGTVGRALENLAAYRWLAARKHVSGGDVRWEYLAHPARKLTETEYQRFASKTDADTASKTDADSASKTDATKNTNNPGGAKTVPQGDPWGCSR